MNSAYSYFKSIIGRLNILLMKLKQSHFKTIQQKIYEYCGINLHEGKQALVRARVMKRIRKLGMNDFSQYLEYLEQDGGDKEFLALVDVLTTNKTSFFRESQHFDFIQNKVIPEIKGRRGVKWWSAGCSTGEEAISCSIVLQEQHLKRNAVKILATDISRDVIQVAKKGVYANKKVSELSPKIRNRYFRRINESNYQITREVRNMITYGRLNLKRKWPLDGPFHVIMCRNVMIYFNRETQQELVSRFYDLLEPKGYLFIGHSESVANTGNGFDNILPAVYRKK